MTKRHVDASEVRHYERSDAPLSPLLMFVVAFCLSGVFIHVVVGGMLSALDRITRPGVSGAFSLKATPPAHPSAPPFEETGPTPGLVPLLQVNPEEELQSFHAREDRILHSWTSDPRTGAVRMPIERAMELLASEAGDAETTSVNQQVNGPALSPAPTDAGAHLRPPASTVDVDVP